MGTKALVAMFVASAALFLFSSPASAQHYLFNRADFPANATFGGMATADFNGDGMLDLAVVGSSPSGTIIPANPVTVLLGKPDGTFGAPVEYQTGGECGPITVGDFNGDGKPDLVLPCITGSVSILLGNGDGTFQAPRPTSIAIFATLTTGDFNHDGKLDVAVINKLNQISVLLGNGDGTFQPPVDYPVESATNAFVTGLTSGDFNGDGKLDLAVTHINCPYGGPCVNNFVGILLGNGDGTFQPKVDYATAAGPQQVAAGDFNHDGNLDLAVVTTGCNKCGLQMVSILLGKGDGTFGAHVEYEIPNYPYAITLGDFNGDGKLDLAVGGTDSSGNLGAAGILLGNGDGTFQNVVEYSGGAWIAGDFNRDGKLDLGFTSNTPTSSAVSILLGNGDGTFLARESSYAGQGFGGGITTGDFNNDGKTDLAVGGTGISVYFGNGDGTFASAPVQSLNTFSFGPLVPGDFNRDGKLDLLSGTGIAYGNGDGTFAGPGPFIPPHVVSIACCTSTNAADFNGDGFLDVVAGGADISSDGAVFTFLGNGDATFQNPITNPSGVNPVAISVADFNRDGKLDVATANLNSWTTSVLLGNGDGTFKTHVDYPAGVDPKWIATGDFNGDGNLDLAVSNIDDGGGAIAILLGNGDGTFQPFVDHPVHQGPSQVLAADFNGDGKLDLAVAYPYNALFDVMLGNGDGTFQSPVAYFAGSGNANGSWLVASDFNGDGAVDLAIASQQYPDSLFVFLNSPVAALYPNPLKFGQQAVGAASAAQPVLVSNPGSAPLVISNLAASGDFAVSGDTCGATVAVGANCTVSVTFTPTTGGMRTGTLVLTDNAGGNTQTVALTGTGLGPAVALSPSGLTFADQLMGTTSAAETVTLTNSGTATLEITGVSASGDFTETNNCGSSLNAGASCSISVNFAPKAGGALSGALLVADNAGSGTQSVSLSGTGAGFSLSATATTLSIAAGNTATYTVSVAPLGGFSQTVTLACSGAPPASTCTLSPASVPLNGLNGSSAKITVTVATMARGADFPSRHPGPGSWSPVRRPLGLLVLAILLSAAALVSKFASSGRQLHPLARRLMLAGALASVLVLLGMMSACGGGGSNGGVSGTPAGSYTITLAATSAQGSTTLNQSLILKLTVF